MDYGLNDNELSVMNRLFAANGRIEQVILYGSHAKGCHKPFSDVDITLLGDNLTLSDVIGLSSMLDASSLPYTFDVSLYSSLKSEELRRHIDRRGIVIYNAHT